MKSHFSSLVAVTAIRHLFRRFTSHESQPLYQMPYTSNCNITTWSYEQHMVEHLQIVWDVVHKPSRHRHCFQVHRPQELIHLPSTEFPSHKPVKLRERVTAEYTNYSRFLQGWRDVNKGSQPKTSAAWNRSCNTCLTVLPLKKKNLSYFRLFCLHVLSGFGIM